MRKTNVLAVALAAMALFSCEEKKKPAPPSPSVVEVKPLDEIPGIYEAHGTVGDGTSMNVLEFVNDDGDTLYITIGAQMVTGGLNVGDEVELVYTVSGDDCRASVAVNLSALQHLWTQRGANGREQSLELNSGGRATTYDMSVDYESWEVRDGRLILRSPKRVGDESPAIADTFEVLMLTPDSLVLMHGDWVTEFERYN